MLQNRPPIVVILGHVDHGKTTLLDALRETNIAAREVGGITQSTRSFQLKTQNSKLITFIDTPGHAAFSQMRSRGGKIADIAILVVAANDGVMPQTKESIMTIKAAGIPMIVAINKTDLPEANVDRVKSQLIENEVTVEDYGGDVPVVNISARNKTGLNELIELIQLISELHPPQADPEGELEAIVLESSLDQKKGPVATVIVKNGVLQEGMNLSLGKVKALTATTGERVKEAPPSTPVEILGLSQVPAVGSVISFTTALPSAPHATTVAGQINQGINIILKVDVLGSLEAIEASLPSGVNIIHSGTGDISESDVMLSQSTGARILGFNIKIASSAAKMAEIEKIKILNFKIIYELLDAIDRLVHPEDLEKILGKAKILAEFKYENQRVAGAKVTEGELKKGDLVRIVRNDQVVAETRYKSLRLGKSETQMVKSGSEFGVIFAPYIDFKVGDDIISYQIHGSV